MQDAAACFLVTAGNLPYTCDFLQVSIACWLDSLIFPVSLQGEDEEDESNELVSQVLDEIGVNLDSEMVTAPGQKQAVAQAVAAEPEAIGTSASGGGDGIDDDLQARLNNLRKQ